MLLQAGTLQGVPEGRPEAPAFFWSPTGGDASFFTSITRGEFARLVQDLKAAIANYASAGATCAMSMANGLEFCTAFLAVSGLRACAMPINPAYTKDEAASYLECASCLLVTSQGNASAEAAAKEAGLPIIRLQLTPAGDSGMPKLVVQVDGGAAAPAAAVPCAPLPTDPALMLFTSGTTGKPKQVPITHGNLVAAIRSCSQVYELGSGDVSMLVMPLFHIHSLTNSFLTPLASGAAVILPAAGKLDPQSFWVDAARFTSTLYSGVPTIHQILLSRAETDYPKGKGPPLRYIRSAGAPLPAATLHALESTFGAPVLEGFAMTETNQVTSNLLPKNGQRKPGSVGKPLPGIEIVILGRDGQVLGANLPGEVALRGPSVFSGYGGGGPAAEAANLEAFEGGWFHTGDEGYYDSDGFLFITGRIKEMVNCGGEKVSPPEVDAVLLQHPEVLEVAVFGLPDEIFGQAVAAAVVFKPGSGMVAAYQDAAAKGEAEQTLKAFALERLAPYKVPSAWFFVDKIPKSDIGKLQRRKLSDYFLAMLKEAQAAAPTVSADDVPALVATAWQEVLGTAPASDSDDFFGAGGNSMAGMQLVSRLAAATGLALSGTLVFRHRTPAALVAALLDALQADDEAAEGGRHAGGPGMHTLPKAGFSPEELAHGVPASVQQEQMLFLHEQDPESGAYNICDAQWLDGEVDSTALAAALGALLQRHPQLRTRFLLPSDAEGAPAGAVGGATVTLQAVAPAPQGAAAVLAAGSAVLQEVKARDEAAALAQLRRAANQPFDLYTAPLMRSVLVRLPGRRALLAVVVHHSVSDGASRGLMVTDLAATYNAAAAAASGGAEAAADAATAALQPLPLDYTDWAAAQRSMLATTGVDEQLAWWQSKLAGVDMVVSLPPRAANEADTTADTARAIPVSLPAELVAQLQKLAQECRCTLFCVLMAAFQLLLGKHSHQDEVVVLTPFANRRHAEVDNVVGYFVSPFPLVTALEGKTFAQLAAGVQDAVLDIHANQDAPLPLIMQALGAAASAPPNATFVLQPANSRPPLELEGIAASRLNASNYLGSAAFDLTLELVEPAAPGAGMEGMLAYSTSVFGEASAKRLVGELVQLLGSAAAAPQAPAATLELLPPAERQLVLSTFADAQGDAPPQGVTLWDMFVRSAEHSWEVPALLDSRGLDHALSYGTTSLAAAHLAGHLREAGVGPGVPVGLLMDRSQAQVLMVLATWAAGGFVVPLDPSHPVARLSSILELSGAPLVVTDELQLAERLLTGLPQGTNAPRVQDAGAWVAEATAGTAKAAAAGAAAHLPALRALGPKPSDTAYLLFTSGSTGKPKGVAVDHAAPVCTITAAIAEVHKYSANATAAATSKKQKAATGAAGPVAKLLGKLGLGKKKETQEKAADQKAEAEAPVLAGSAVVYRMPVSFDPSILDIMGALGDGRTLLIAEGAAGKDPGALAQLILDAPFGPHSVYVLLVPALLNGMLLESPETLAALGRKLSVLCCGGDALSAGLVGRFLDACGHDLTVLNMYGPTEASILVTLHAVGAGPGAAPAPSPDDLAVLPIGTPLPGSGARLLVLDGAMQPVPVGGVGELFIAGPVLAQGYLGRDPIDGEAFMAMPEHLRGGWASEGEASQRIYRTGDLVRWLPDGSLQFCGRAAGGYIKLRGLRIETGEIEVAMCGAPGVAAAAVRKVGDRLVGYYTAGKGAAPVSVQELRAVLAARLPAYMVPEAFMELAEMPLGSTGKVNYRALPDPVWSESAVGAGTPAAGWEAPVSPMEKLVAAVLRRVLHPAGSPGWAQPVGATDGFVELGGSSLQAIYATAQLRSMLACPAIPGNLILGEGTVRACAAALEAVLGGGEAASAKAAAALAKIEAQEGLGEAAAPQAGAEALPVQDIETNQDYTAEELAAGVPATLQQRYYLGLFEANPASVGENMPGAYELTGAEVDASALAAAVEGLVARHAALRTSFFKAADGTWMQRVAPPEQAAAFVEVQTAYVAEHLGAALARQLSASLSTTLSHDMGAALPQAGSPLRGGSSFRAANVRAKQGLHSTPSMRRAPSGRALLAPLKSASFRAASDGAVLRGTASFRAGASAGATPVIASPFDAPQRHAALATVHDDQVELNAYQSEAELDVRMKEGLHLPAAVLERLAAEVTRPFDLAGGGPLLRILLLRCPRGSSVVLFNLHHIIGDGWTMGLICSELSTLYDAAVKLAKQGGDLVAQVAASLPPPKTQVTAYSKWQAELMAAGGPEPELSFWRSQLAPLPKMGGLAALPIDHPRPQVPSFHGDVVPVALPPGSAQAAALLSQRLGVTTLAIVSAAWRLLLSAEAGHCGGGPEGGYAADASGAVVLGTPTACRGRLEDHDVVGCLSSMLPLLPGAATYAAGDTFESLVQREAAALAAAAANADRCPLGAIGDVAPGLPPGGALALPRALFRARAIVFDAAMLRGGLRLGGATGAMLHRKCFVHIAKFELELELVARADLDQRLVGHIEYDTELFGRPTVVALARRLEALLTRALVEPRTPPHHLLDAVAPAGPSPSPTTLEQLAAMV